jgi:hypothetical protein
MTTIDPRDLDAVSGGIIDGKPFPIPPVRPDFPLPRPLPLPQDPRPQPIPLGPFVPPTNQPSIA